MGKIKIVVTGGPSGGKTTLIEALQKDLKGKVSVVPEAASILYRGGFPRRATPEGRKHVQRAICYTQRELEDLIGDETQAPLLVCDRGSLDSVAYWPGEAAEFFSSFQTSKEAELARYQWVIHLDTADQDSFDTTNPIRTESHKEALDLNEKIKTAWQGHPQRIIIPHEAEFLSKIGKAKAVIEKILAGQNFSQVRAQLGE
ncbi:MAG: ATP-binding protein [Pseudobdellovibrionaceae bacterium]